MRSNDAYARGTKPAVAARLDSGDDGDSQASIYYRLDVTGHIMITSTTKTDTAVDPDVEDLFKKSAVMFSALTAAMSKAGKKLYDYDSFSKLLTSTGFVVSLGIEDRTFSSSTTDATVSAQLIQLALNEIGSVSAEGQAFNVAQNILNGMQGNLKLSISNTSSEKKIAHLMFICQNLMGMPVVAISLFYADATESSDTVNLQCASVSTTSVSVKFHQEDFMFVDPVSIQKFSGEFVQSSDYGKLVDDWASRISA